MLWCIVCGAIGFAIGAVLGMLLMSLLNYGRSEDD
jgi:hypothetical protein